MIFMIQYHYTSVFRTYNFILKMPNVLPVGCSHVDHKMIINLVLFFSLFFSFIQSLESTRRMLQMAEEVSNML